MLQPLFARVLLKRDELKTKSNLMVPEAYKKRNAPSRGKVIAKGPTASDEVVVGGTYLFGQHAGAWVNEDGTAIADEGKAEYFICMDEDLLIRLS